MATQVIMLAAALWGCPLRVEEVGAGAFPPPALGLGELTETAGKGGSSTSESFRIRSGAWTGGSVSAVITCSRPPG